MIAHFDNPRVPQFHFEWHPETKKVYVIRLGVVPLVGEVIAEHADTHGQAYGFVQTWCRGYKTRDAELIGDGVLNGVR